MIQTMTNAYGVPILDVFLQNDITNVTGDFTVATVIYDTVNTGANYYSNGIFTTPVGGIFVFCVQLCFLNIIGGNNSFGGQMLGSFNTITWCNGGAIAIKAPDNTLTQSITLIKQLANPGDNFKISGFINNGTKVSGFKGSGKNRLQIYRIS